MSAVASVVFAVLFAAVVWVVVATIVTGEPVRLRYLRRSAREAALRDILLEMAEYRAHIEHDPLLGVLFDPRAACDEYKHRVGAFYMLDGPHYIHTIFDASSQRITLAIDEAERRYHEDGPR